MEEGSQGGSTVEVDIIRFLDVDDDDDNVRSNRLEADTRRHASVLSVCFMEPALSQCGAPTLNPVPHGLSQATWASRSKRSSLYDRRGQARLALPKRPGQSYHKLRAVAKKHNHKYGNTPAAASADMFRIYREVVGLAP